jgi:hypothetical protein
MGSGEKAALIVVGIAIGAAVLVGGYGGYVAYTRKPSNKPEGVDTYTGKDRPRATGRTIKQRKSIRKRKTKNNK